MQKKFKFLTAVLTIYIIGFIMNTVVFSSNSCDSCPVSKICDEASSKGEINLCEDPRYQKYFKENKLEELKYMLKNEKAAATNESTEITININNYEVTIENKLNAVPLKIPSGI
ncbi:MAG: hypothetical protein QMC67_06045 [Candidatus Wallbacteria bacterium]